MPSHRDQAASRLSDTELVAAIRREEPAAIAELYRRFAPLLRRSVGAWPTTDGEALVEEVIGDVALTLMRPTTATPRSLAAYLIVALRHRAAAALRTDDDRARMEGECAGNYLASDREATPLHPVLARLVAHLDADLDDQERLLLAWIAEHVPMRTVAAWLGVGYDAALKRASRLRARLRASTLGYISALPPDDRRVADAFLGRAAPLPDSSTPRAGSEAGS